MSWRSVALAPLEVPTKFVVCSCPFEFVPRKVDLLRSVDAVPDRLGNAPLRAMPTCAAACSTAARASASCGDCASAMRSTSASETEPKLPFGDGDGIVTAGTDDDGNGCMVATGRTFAGVPGSADTDGRGVGCGCAANAATGKAESTAAAVHSTMMFCFIPFTI